MVHAAKTIMAAKDYNTQIMIQNPDYKNFIDHYINKSCDDYGTKMCELIQARSSASPGCQKPIGNFVKSAVNFWQQPCHGSTECSQALSCLYWPQDPIPLGENHSPITDCGQYYQQLQNINWATEDQSHCMSCHGKP